MISRDLVQGFIDGYKLSGGDMSALADAILTWLQNNTLYPTTVDEQQRILSDIGSYRT